MVRLLAMVGDIRLGDGAVGFLIGSTIFGLNLLITCGWLRMNTNDAFSAFRLGSYNNFLRLKIVGDTIDVYAIGLDRRSQAG